MRCNKAQFVSTLHRDKYITLFSHPDLTLTDLQEQATSRKGLGEAEDELGGVTLRSLFWRLYLGTLDVKQVLSSTPRALLGSSLREQRRQYDTLREKWLVSPDGRWAPDCTSPDDAENTSDSSAGSEVGRRTDTTAESITWDPLNLGETVSPFSVPVKLKQRSYDQFLIF